MTVRGVVELGKVLDSLSGKEFLSVQRSAARAAGRELAADMARRVPRDQDDDDDYSLAENMQVRAEPKQTRDSEVQFRVGPSRETATEADRYGKAGYKIKGGLNRGKSAPNYASLVEADTPFMRPAFDAGADGMVRTFRTTLGKRLERIARREARKNAAK